MRCILLALCLCLFSFSAYSADDFEFSTKIDVMDQDASIAKQKALNNAAKEAILAAARHFSDSAGLEQLSSMTDDQLINFIKETFITDEKNSANRYIANLRIIVNNELLKTYLREKGFTIAEQNTPTVIIIPLLNDPQTGFPLLWELNNTWKQFWEEQSLNSSIAIKTIKEDTDNISAISALQAFDVDIAGLKKIKQLNHADDVYVLAASSNNHNSMEVNISSLSGYQKKLDIINDSSSQKDLFNQAVSLIVPIIEQQTLNDISEDGSGSDSLTFLFPFDQLNDWINAEKQIKSLREVVDLQIQAFSPGKAQFVVVYNNNKEDLLQSLRSLGYILEDSGNYMIMRNFTY